MGPHQEISGLLIALCHILDQVAQLLGSEIVAFEIGYQPAATADDHGVKGMHKKCFIRIKGHIEAPAELLDVRNRSCQEMPSASVRIPGAGILSKSIWLVMNRIDDDC